MFRRSVVGGWIAWWLLNLWQFVGAVELTRGPIVQSTSTNAVVRWTTDVASGTRLNYGPDIRHLDRRVDPGVVAGEHEVTLSGLSPGTTYWYSIGTARTPLATNSFTTANLVGRTSPSGSTGPTGPATVASAGAELKGSKDSIPPARMTWGAPRTLQDHFDRHGQDFAAKSPEDYAAKAWLFLRRATAEGLPAKLDEDGVLRVYEPKTKTFAAYNRDLTTKTFFKPGRPNYFDDQPGKPVNLKTIVK